MVATSRSSRTDGKHVLSIASDLESALLVPLITRAVLLLALLSCGFGACSTIAVLPQASGANEPVATFSIVAFDPARKQWGVAVQSKLAIGHPRDVAQPFGALELAA